MTAIRDAALSYAANDWPVLALHTNTDEGCSCRSLKAGHKPGKHPRTDLCPQGVKSATTDPRVIAAWPNNINIGVALGRNGLMALDVDDPHAASAFLAPDMVLSDETGLVVTGRPGLHIYFTCSGDVRGHNIRDDQGRDLGELRGLGQYVVAPPSLSPSLRPYRWIGRPAGEVLPALATTTDALAYVRELYRSIGIVIVVNESMDDEAIDLDVPLDDRDLPPLLTREGGLILVRQILSGTLPRMTEPDRSGKLWKMAVEIATVGYERGMPLGAEELAGVLKKADRLYYGKYVGQRSEGAGDRALRKTARDALATARQAAPSAATGAESPDPLADTGVGAVSVSGAATVTSATYEWDTRTGTLYYVQQHKNSVAQHKVANFLPTLLAEVTVDRGGEDTEVVWHVQLQLRDGRSEILRLHSEDYESSYALERALSRLTTAEYIVHAGMYKHIKPALQELTPTEQVERYKRRAVPGWYEYGSGRVFLLPGVRGAIGAGGIDPSVRMRDDDTGEGDPINDPALALYGRGVRPPATAREQTAAWDALCALIGCGSSSVTVPIALQVLAGPLREAGAGSVPPLVHVIGRTGFLKTAFCLSALSLLGTFTRDASPPASWLSTSPTEMRSLLYAAKDLTFLADDYKEGAGINKDGLLEIIQNYADKTARRRATSAGVSRRPKNARCILLSNGEDRWERQASAIARTIVVQVGEADIVQERLADVQERVVRGELQLFGGAFLTWLAGNDDLFENRTLDRVRERLNQRMLGRYKGPVAHRRIIQSAATLLAVGQTVLDFAHETAPAYEGRVRGWLVALGRQFLEGVHERAAEVANLSPFRQLTGAIAHEMAAGRVALYPADGISDDNRRVPDQPGAEAIGWWGRDGSKKRVAYISESRTFGWYKGFLKAQGEAPTFGWQAFLQEARNGYGGRPETRRLVTGNARSQLRVVAIPLVRLLEQADDGAKREEGEE